MNKFILEFSSTAYDPTAAMQGLDSATNALATHMVLTGTNGELKPHDLPIYINGHNEISNCLYTMKICTDSEDPDHDEIPTPSFSVGSLVVHKYTGRKQIVDAIIYNHGERAHYYVTTYCPPTGISRTLQHSRDELMSEHSFELLNYDLNQATGKIWHMDQEIKFFVNTSNKARKMRMSDARHAINTHVTGDEAPF